MRERSGSKSNLHVTGIHGARARQTTSRFALPLLVAASFVLAPSPSSAQLSTEQRPVVVDIEGCTDLDRDSLQRVLAVELGGRLVSADSWHPYAREVSVHCLSGFVRVAVEDVISDRSYVRFVDLAREPVPARPRVLALTIAEALSASESEGEPAEGHLLAPSPATKNTPASRGPALIAGIRDTPGGARGAGSSEHCVPRDVYEAVLQCPVGAEPPRQNTARPDISNLSSNETSGDAAEGHEKGPGLSARDAERAGSSEPTARRRPLTILRREIELNEDLVENTLPTAPELADRLLHLAIVYEQLSQELRFAARELDRRIFEAQSAGRAHIVQELRQRQLSLDRGEAEARTTGLRQYERWVRTFPGAPTRDAVLLRLSRLLEEQARYYRLRADNVDSPVLAGMEQRYRAKARQANQQLLRETPNSPLVPFAHLALARSSRMDGEDEAALRHFRLAAEDGRSPVAPLAAYETAWHHVARQEHREAVSEFVNAIGYARTHSDQRVAQPIAHQARLELVLPYSRAYPPNQAWRFFNDRKVGGESAPAMMESLARRYFSQGQWRKAAATYRTLITSGEASDRLCVWQVELADSVLRNSPQREQLREAHRTVALMREFLSEPHPPAAKASCRGAVARLLVDLATSWHSESVGPDSEPDAGDEATMRRAAEVYRLLLDELSDLDDLQEVELTSYGLRFWYAELLYALEEWEECGPAYDEVVEMDTRSDAEYLREAARGAVVCYERLHSGSARTEETRVREPAPAVRRELTLAEQALLGAYSRYLCFVSESTEVTYIGHQRARVYLSAHQLEEAAVLFREVASAAPQDELGRESARWYVDTLRAIGDIDSGRFRSCRDEMEVAIDGFLEDERITVDEELEQALIKGRCGVMWSRADEHAARGEHDRCAALYLDIFEDYRDICEEIGQHGLDEVLYNAAHCLEEDRRVGPAIKVRQRLISEFGDESSYAEKHGRVSPLVGPTLFRIGASFQSIASFEKAADHYERFAEGFPREKQARNALYDATLFRIRLGHHERALKNARLFERTWGDTQPAESASIVHATGTILLERHDWPEAAQHYRRFIRKYGGGASPAIEIQGRVALAYSLWQSKGPERGEASVSFERALALADLGRSAEESAAAKLSRYKALLGSAPRRKADDQRALLGLVNAIAKARFYRAEAEYERFDAIERVPFVPRGSLPPKVRAWWIKRDGGAKVRSLEAGFRHLRPAERRQWINFVQFEHWLTTWTRGRNEARTRAQDLYVKAAGEGMPEWEIAAAARLGDMFRSEMSANLDVSIPRAISEDPDLLATYEAAFDARASEFRALAIGAYLRCLRVSTGNRWFNEWSRRCERGLNELSPRDFPLADEITSDPVHYRQRMLTPEIIRRAPAAER